MRLPRDRLKRAVSPRWRRYLSTRRRVARRYLRGEGIEIGALHMPLELPGGASVRYLDRMSTRDLRLAYPELGHEPVVEVDVVDDAERLQRIPEGSLDFIVANHLLEHCQDPLGTLACHARRLRTGGVLFLAIPDRRHGVDRLRTATTIEHLVRDHAEGPGWSRRGHFEDWVRAADGLPAGTSASAVADKAALLDQQDQSIHFHAWTPDEFAELIARVQDLGTPLRLEALVPNFHEFIAVLCVAPGEVGPTRDRDG